MKAKILIAAAALGAALVLTACGGKESFTVGGVFVTYPVRVQTSVPNPGLVLANGSDTVTVPAGATSFSFPNTISYGSEYHVTIKSQPQHMTCTPLDGTENGAAGHTQTIVVQINCNQNTYALSGTVTGLTADGLTIINGSNGSGASIPKDATGFTYTERIPVGVAYGLTVLTQPTGLQCSITNGTGVMGDADRANISIACVPKT
ncbi:hypothetical protein [Massilia endophytica]|uniref:hypothetical protein n=1 Tax=Massilia endophytica TaxID=2899220 RepID=UPI001E3D0305|nr:hypothetical protein [Massilia endophytica]UGQ45961.1 hypothetical protein LSQ66_19570 [Massilia endophytica]